MASRTLVALALVCAPRLAAAEYYDVVAGEPSPAGLMNARQILPPSELTGVAASRVIYLTHGGATVRPGDNDSQAGLSSIVAKETTIPAWDVSASVWSATVACIQQVYAPFAVTVTETDPKAVPHIEAIFGGSPSMLGLSSHIAGVSPFTEDCGIIESSIVYIFTDVLDGNAHAACEVAAQEIAHSYGLDHEMLASDPMTYLPYSGDRVFADQTVACGEYTARPCGINGSTCRANQSSVALLAARVGMAGTTPPTSTDAVDPPGDLRGGCATGGGGGLPLGLLLAGLVRRARR